MKTLMSAVMNCSVSQRRARKLGLAAREGFALWAISPLLAWHRDHFSGSVADAIHPRSLDTLTDYDMKREFGNGTSVLLVLPERVLKASAPTTNRHKCNRTCGGCRRRLPPHRNQRFLED
jgi:hypothetical protein